MTASRAVPSSPAAAAGRHFVPGRVVGAFGRVVVFSLNVAEKLFSPHEIKLGMKPVALIWAALRGGLVVAPCVRVAGAGREH